VLLYKLRFVVVETVFDSAALASALEANRRAVCAPDGTRFVCRAETGCTRRKIEPEPKFEAAAAGEAQ